MRNKRIVIKTNKYAGNFERELVGYCFGRLSDEQENAGHAREYVKAFWQKYATCNDYAGYLLKEEEQKKFEDLMRKADSLLGLEGKHKKISMQDIYEDYLEFHREEVDDDYENTFYSIEDKEISIWLKQDLPEKYLNLFMERIKSFFSNRVLEVFENAIYLTKFDSLSPCDNNVKLLDLYVENGEN